MSKEPRSVIMRVPVSIQIGPVPDELTSHSQLFTFALAHIKKILSERGVVAEFDGERALASYFDGEAVSTFTALGAKLDDRHFQIQPDGDMHQLLLSVDRGVTFVPVASFNDHDIADAIGRAWVDGRAEKPAS